MSELRSVPATGSRWRDVPRLKPSDRHRSRHSQLVRRPAAPLREGQVAAALADDPGRAILAACVMHARHAREISEVTGVPLTSCYRHIHRLESLGVLVVERSALTAAGRKYDLYRSRVRRAHMELDEEGARVRWEPNGPLEERLASLWEHFRAEV